MPTNVRNENSLGSYFSLVICKHSNQAPEHFLNPSASLARSATGRRATKSTYKMLIYFNPSKYSSTFSFRILPLE